MHHFCAKLSFLRPILIPSFLFFPERLHCCCYIYFHCSYLYNFYNCLEPCALNAEFQHLIPRFNQTSLLCRLHSKRGIGGEKRPKDRVKTGWLYGFLSYLQTDQMNGKRLITSFSSHGNRTKKVLGLVIKAWWT
jgi:hypothetical protein